MNYSLHKKEVHAADHTSDMKKKTSSCPFFLSINGRSDSLIAQYWWFFCMIENKSSVDMVLSYVNSNILYMGL